MELYNSDIAREIHTPALPMGDYLARPASVFREQVAYSPRAQTTTLSYTTNIDMYIRIINYEDGPIYCDLPYVRGETKSVVSGTRIVRKISTRQWLAHQEERNGDWESPRQNAYEVYGRSTLSIPETD